jgi:LytR cell envelope-related transcriptional attenuator
MRARTESALLLVAAALVCAFVASFALGMLAGDDPAGGEPQVRIADPPPASPPPVRVTEAAARVEVLNASGTSGLARRATEALRTAGFDVVYFGNASGATAASADSGSIVIDRIGELARAEAVARALGIGRVITRADASLLLDATVVLGKDWPVRPDSMER